MKAAIYLRISTKDESINSQRADTLHFAKKHGFEPVIFEDYPSGEKFSRQALDEMMHRVRRHEFDTVICDQLYSLGRSLIHLAQLLGEFDSYGVGLIAWRQDIDTTHRNLYAPTQIRVLNALTSFRCSKISDRTLAGLEAAKKRSVKLGRPKGSKSIPHQRKKLAIKVLAETPNLSCPKLARAAGISVGTAHKWKKEFAKSYQDWESNTKCL